ncbi:deoxyribodipyrimidine photo-lyase [Spirochaeta cellobiosiphila]|uniref:deoxyribodipyrimidine photo-lyase n=1 Tax=Spirochaeta cellobiosiphila TaxID=504483 RepID=UPI0003FA4629|nr:deoxyribodipyrimidine photo-lyase [Spirochaeta cellobiosiphila]
MNQHVLYWMQASPRTKDNQALIQAIDMANQNKVSVKVLFVLTPFPEGNLRHYQFMLEGLRDVSKSLQSMGIGFEILKGDPIHIILEESRKALYLIMDKGYLRIQRHWRQQIYGQLKIPYCEIEDNVLYPVEEISNKREWSAYTLRRKIQKTTIPQRSMDIPCLLNEYTQGSYSVMTDEELEQWLNQEGMDTSLRPVKFYKGGEQEALRRLDRFLQYKLDKYGEERNHPEWEGQSDLAPYLHFGQISPYYIVSCLPQPYSQGAEDFFEELVVRRELAINFVYYTEAYDKYDCLPDWAQKTLEKHKGDPRPTLYTLEELDKGSTHDVYWNAAQNEMVITGKMHGYMRMYWGKKVLEWAPTPEEAFEWLIYLNNRYSLDGRDPNTYAGIGWCFGNHDRPWTERSVFGTIRYMAASGLKRKFDIDTYVFKIGNLSEE